MKYIYAFDCEDRSYSYGELDWYGTRTYVLAKNKREAVNKLHKRFVDLTVLCSPNKKLEKECLEWVKKNITKTEMSERTYRINVKDIDKELEDMRKDIYHIKAEMAKLEEVRILLETEEDMSVSHT
jgi:hypothetical protein